MESEFLMYSFLEKKKIPASIVRKIKTDVRGSFTYVLIGIDSNGNSLSTIVNKSQWDRFDAPIEERKIDKKIGRRIKRERSMNGNFDSHGRKPEKKFPPKGERHVYDEEIERWLLENAGMDFEKIIGNNKSNKALK